MSKHIRCSANPTYSFRALTPKVLKTVELTRLQVGPAGPVNLAVSTIAEAELLVPYLASCGAQGRVVNVLYGFPVPPSAVPRLARLAKLPKLRADTRTTTNLFDTRHEVLRHYLLTPSHSLVGPLLLIRS